MILDIFLRTCSRKGSTQQSTRCITDTREIMIKKCVSSLITSIKLSTHSIKLYIIDDHSSEDFIQWLNDIKDINVEIIPLENTGNNASMAFQVNFAKEYGRELIYLVEDDFFHMPNAIQTMIDTYQKLNQLNNFYLTAIYPYDCADRYIRDMPMPSRIFYIDNLYWRTITRTTFTIFIHKTCLTNFYNVFHKFATGYSIIEGIGEDTTINTLYNDTCSFGGPVLLFSPMPSLAIHIEHQEPTQIRNDLLINWKELWKDQRI